MTTDLLFGDVQMPPQNEPAGGIIFQLLFEKVRRKGIGVMEDDNVGPEFAEGLFEQLSVGEGERLRGDLGKTARADDLHAVHLAARIPLFVVKTKYPDLVRAFERVRTIARDLLDPADKREIIVTDLQYFHLYARFPFVPPAPRDADGGRGRSAYEVRNKKSMARRARNKGGTLVPPMSPIGGRAALRLAVRERRCAKFPVAGEFVLSGYVLRCRRGSFGYLSGVHREPIGRLHGICRIPIKYNAAEMIRNFPEMATRRKRAERTGITTFQLCRTLPPSARRQNKICSLIPL